MPWMIYGANGYTGELIAREAARRGLRPTLAGRNTLAIEKLATELKFDFRIFDLDTVENALDGITEMQLVLNCAGPFSITAEVMMTACLENKSHYLDITGEIDVFELAQGLSSQAKKKKLIFCPGVGFDVIPTDCVASTLAKQMPDATHLRLGYDSRSGLSAGTAKTTVEGMKNGGRIRQNGEIIPVPLAYKTDEINFGKGTKLAVTIPWGDVSTAFHSTGIPNIEAYIPTSTKSIRMMKAANLAKPILGMGLVQDMLKKQAGKVSGPSLQERQENPCYVWGEVTNSEGKKKVARIKTANGYEVTIHGSLAIVCHILMERNLTGGAYTPSLLMGENFIERLEGCGEIYLFDD